MSKRHYHIRKSTVNNSWYIAENGYIFLENFASTNDAKQTLKDLYGRVGADFSQVIIEIHR